MALNTNSNHASDLAKYWLLDKDAFYLNHGAFGACPVPILEKQQEYRNMLESHPIRFMLREMDDLIYHSKTKLAVFTGVKQRDIAFVTNATQGVNTVLKSLTFKKGDEILITNHIYPACRNTVNYIAKKTGAVVVEAMIDFPVMSEDYILEQLLYHVTPKTKIALIDHITSPTGIIMPVAEIVAELDKKGIDTIVDGAHALGNIPLKIEEFGAAYYTGNCHKWLCAPKGAAFLYARSDKKRQIDPLTISLCAGDDKSFEQKFYWTGTHDPTPFICIADAIEFMGTLYPGGWDELMTHNHQLAVDVRKMICDRLGIPLPSPDYMLASMAAFPVKDTDNPVAACFNAVDELQEKLYKNHNIEVPVNYWPSPPKRMIRISCQAYNSMKQYEVMMDALAELGGI
jgi:isopenicillin-N epimerase